MERRDRELEFGEVRFEVRFPGGEGVDPSSLRHQRLEDGFDVVVHLLGASGRIFAHLVEVGAEVGVHGGDEGVALLLPAACIERDVTAETEGW